MVLVRPAGEVSVALDGQSHVGHHGHHVGLPVVEGLHGGEQHGVPLDEVGQLVEELAPPGGVHGAPGTAEPGGGGGANCNIWLMRIVQKYG